jgi:uridine phosphorylase
MTEDREYHIGIAPGEIPELVLLPGDPHRAQDIAVRFFDEYEEIAKSREYWSFKGKWRGIPVASCSTGIGCPSAAIALEELVEVGCTTFLRVGTSGAISRSVNTGDLVIFTGSVRDDGTSQQYVPIEYPAVADPEMVMALIKSAEKNGATFHVGIGHTKDAFYSEHPDYVADPMSTRKKWELLRNSGVLATEMEAASLFIVGQLRGVKVGTICLVIGENVEKEAKIDSKPPIDELIIVALDAITSLKQ